MGEQQRSYRQQQWMNAHERADQCRTEGLFDWWIDLRFKGRLTGPNTDISMSDELRLHNAQQVAPLPFTFA
ncbi:hypothetical protein BG58_33255 [Caballeronia jiangsuensis]|nr:hypothetical protein BG58_33255 [Caballeronia jiangsuensis]